MKVLDKPAELNGRTVGESLLEPTRIYFNPIIELLGQYKVKKVVHGMAHITGGGLAGNIARILPDELDAVIDKNSWEVPVVFDFLQQAGPVEENEMYKVFNMGIGFVLVVAEDFANSITKKLSRYGEKVFKIGKIKDGNGKVSYKSFDRITESERS
jgi:phosphoribosylformylglycinamidine cyclo-ligase